jgi:hypothetical protein
MIFEHAFCVLAGLLFNARKRVTFWLRLNRADYFLISEKQIVGFASFGEGSVVF